MTEEARPTGTTEEPAPGTTEATRPAADGSADPAAGGSGTTEPSVEERLAAKDAELEEQRRINAQLLAEKSNRVRTDGGSNGAVATAQPNAATDAARLQAQREAEEVIERARAGDADAILTLFEAESRARRESDQRRDADRFFDQLPTEYRAEARTLWESGEYTPKAAGNAAKVEHEAQELREKLAEREKETKPSATPPATPAQRAAGYVGSSDRSVSAGEHAANPPVKVSDYQDHLRELRVAGKIEEAKKYMRTAVVIPDG